MLNLLRQNSFILTLLGLSLLCLALNEARADVKGIPFNDHFASASYPHARTVSGCTEWRRPERLGDEWGPVSFAGACEEHDRCFHTQGATWAGCNQRYLVDLQAACDRDLARERLEKSRASISSKPDPQALRLCYEIVGLYHARVQGLEVARRFALSQKQNDEYLAYVRSTVNEIYRAVLRRSATPQEKEQALKTLAADYSLDDLKAALMGQRLDQDAARGDAEPVPAIDGISNHNHNDALSPTNEGSPQTISGTQTGVESKLLDNNVQ